MKCFLIGSDKDLLESIETYLFINFFYISSCEKSNSWEEAEKMLQNIKPDLIILDVVEDLEYLSAFLKKVTKLSIDLITIVPSKFGSINILEEKFERKIRKPINYNELRFHINTFYINQSKEKDLQYILKRIRNTIPKKRIAIPQEKEIQMIPIQDIIYIEADINYCQIYILDKKSIFVSKTLKSFEQQLLNNTEFYRIHQSYLINLNYINKIIKTKLPQVLMSNGDILTISRSKKVGFFKLILQ